MKKYVYSFLICGLLLGSTPNIKTSYYSYGLRHYICLLTEIIITVAMMFSHKITSEKIQCDKQILEKLQFDKKISEYNQRISLVNKMIGFIK